MTFESAQGFFQSLIQLLPASPFLAYRDPNYLYGSSYSSIARGIRWLNWIVPVSDLMEITLLWLTAVAGYYALSAVLRWVKLIGG